MAKPCADMTELFVEHVGELKDERQAREAVAKDVCGGCDVRVECLAFAVEHDEQGAIWGGFNDDERRQAARAAQRVKVRS